MRLFAIGAPKKGTRRAAAKGFNHNCVLRLGVQVKGTVQIMDKRMSDALCANLVMTIVGGAGCAVPFSS